MACFTERTGSHKGRDGKNKAECDSDRRSCCSSNQHGRRVRCTRSGNSREFGRIARQFPDPGPADPHRKPKWPKWPTPTGSEKTFLKNKNKKRKWTFLKTKLLLTRNLYMLRLTGSGLKDDRRRCVIQGLLVLRFIYRGVCSTTPNFSLGIFLIVFPFSLALDWVCVCVPLLLRCYKMFNLHQGWTGGLRSQQSGFIPKTVVYFACCLP